MGATSLSFHQQFFLLNSLKIDQHVNFRNPIWRRKRRSVSARCSLNKPGGEKNYYEFLGVSVDASSQEIKDSYRKLQKKHHPDIAGEKGHKRTLMLNEAYKVLMRDELRKKYDASIGKIGFGDGKSAFGSVWKGPLRPQALFVDENACIGCRQCVDVAGNTFTMDDAFGTARVKVQHGDDDERIETSIESCPVNCIHRVDAEELAVLEYLIQPQPKAGYGIYGQGWERPANVFKAAKSFKKPLNQKEGNQQRYGKSSEEEETPAQAQARKRAYRELKIGSFARIWSWIKKNTGQ